MAKKLTSEKALEILSDGKVHGKRLTRKQKKFFGAVAGGAEPQKAQIGGLITGFHPKLAETVSDVLSAPQKAATQLVTGKYQTPSEALDIQNRIGAFFTDIVLDPLNFLGVGAVKKVGAFDNLSKINPFRFKEDPNAYYRMLGGKEGFDDAVKAGILRPASKQLDFVPFIQGQVPDTKYAGPYMVEVKDIVMTPKGMPLHEYLSKKSFGKYSQKDLIFAPEKTKPPIQTTSPNVKFYKKDRLRGYKEVKLPKKKQDGGAVEGRMGGLTDKGFNFNPAWGGAWRNGGDLSKLQTGDTFTPYSRDYLTNFRDEWVKSYNQPIPYALPTDDRFDKFFLEKRATVPEYYETKSGWVKGLGTGMEEFREGDKNTPPKSMGKPAKGYEWVENYKLGPFKDQSQIAEYNRLIKSVRNAESDKPIWNRDVKFENGGWLEKYADGGNLQPPMSGAMQPALSQQFAMGGSLPGSVGFTYARTGGTPSEGPYAKKTMPSAQNGMEMKYYQEGLDWKPKTISKNGGWLDKYEEDIPKGQKGLTRDQMLDKIRREHEIYTQNRGDLAQQSGVPTRGEVARQAQIRKEAEAFKKKQEARARYEAMPKIGPARERNYSEQVQAEEQRRRLNQAYAAQNPEVTIDESGDIVPSGYGRFIQTYGPNLDKFARSLETPLAIQGVGELAYGLGKVGARYLPQVGEYLTTQTPLRNASKYNPFRFKEDPNAYYRKIGDEEGLLDLQTSGVVRSKPIPEELLAEYKRRNISTYPDPYFAVGKPAEVYRGKYMVEYKGDVPFNRFKVLDEVATPQGTIYLNDPGLKVYKQHWLRGYKEVPKPTKKKGGEVIKDNDGYWNPENWGKVVEINSPYITMKGVDQPLIGVSDTGDVQYMEPGKDYEFDGTKVREYPIAQGGRQVSSRTSGPRLPLSPSIPTAADSLLLYKNALEKERFYRNNPDYKVVNRDVVGETSLKDRKFLQELADESVTTYNQFKKPNIYNDISSFGYSSNQIMVPNKVIFNKLGRVEGSNVLYKAPDVTRTIDTYHNPNAPVILFSPQIIPQGERVYFSETFGDRSRIPHYEPLAVKPYAMRTEKEKVEWEKKYGKPKPKPSVKKETPKTETKKAPVKSVPQTTDQLSMFRNANVELLVDQFGNYEWFRKDDPGDMIPVRRATREEIEYSKKQKQRNGGVSVNKADEYPLKKLDDLLNFTNYNKPKAKSGGWLDKYN